MAEQDRDTYKAMIDSTINTNATKAITGALANTAHKNLADSVVFKNENQGKANVRFATTAPVTLATGFENGDTHDGVTLVTGNRFLNKDAVDPTENGIYTVNASGAPTRATDFDSSSDIKVGQKVYVEEGTVNGGKYFYLSAPTGTITVGTSNLVFSQEGSTLSISGMSAFSGTIDTTNDQGVIYDDSASANKKIAFSRLIPEYGTWTPTLQFGTLSTGVTYSAQNGHYCRQVMADGKKLMYITCDMIVTSKGSATGDMAIGGLPEIGESTVGSQILHFGVTKGASTFSVTDLHGRLSGSPQTRVTIYKDDGTTAVQNTDLTVSTSITFRLSGTYIASA